MNEQLNYQNQTSNSWKLLVIVIFLFLAGFGLIWSGFKEQSSFLVATPSVTQVPEENIPPQSLGITGQQAQVTRVIDGDTVEVSIDNELQKIRLIGVDTPETVDPRREVGCFGKEASAVTKKLVDGKIVLLVRDISETDKFDRLLRYVYVRGESREEIFVNDYLVREGFAKAVTFPPDVKFSEQFRDAEREAREQKKGLWGKC